MGLLDKIFKSEDKNIYRPTNELEHVLKLTLQDDKNAPYLARRIFRSDLLVLGSRVSEDGIERMTFNRVPVKNDIVVLGFTSKAALQPYTVNANVTTPKYMKVNGYQLIKMIQGRLGLRLNWSIDLGCTLSPSQLAGLVAKYGKAVIKVSSPEPI